MQPIGFGVTGPEGDERISVYWHRLSATRLQHALAPHLPSASFMESNGARWATFDGPVENVDITLFLDHDEPGPWPPAWARRDYSRERG